MATALDRLKDNVRARVPAVLDVMLELELKNILHEFFDETNTLIAAGTINIVPNVQNYSVTVTSGKVTRLMSLTNANGSRVPAGFVFPDKILLSSIPSQAEKLTAIFAMTPDDTPFTSIPDWVFQKYQTILIDGVLGRLMSQIAKPYTSERLAIYHMRRFRNGCATARVEAMRRYNFNAQAWAFPTGMATGGLGSTGGSGPVGGSDGSSGGPVYDYLTLNGVIITLNGEPIYV